MFAQFVASRETSRKYPTHSGIKNDHLRKIGAIIIVTISIISWRRVRGFCSDVQLQVQTG